MKKAQLTMNINELTIIITSTTMSYLLHLLLHDVEQLIFADRTGGIRGLSYASSNHFT